MVDRRSPPPASMIERMTLILGLESSCDETAAAIVDGERRILAHRLAGQEAAHAPYGGVVPEIAHAIERIFAGEEISGGAFEQALRLIEFVVHKLSPGLVSFELRRALFSERLGSFLCVVEGVEKAAGFHFAGDERLVGDLAHGRHQGLRAAHVQRGQGEELPGPPPGGVHELIVGDDFV